jgi:predicted alpha-1,6-mannanase (GH76 family)
MAAKYIISGMKYETGIAIGLNAVTEATKTDQPKVRYLDAIRKVKRIARANETEFMLLVQT